MARHANFSIKYRVNFCSDYDNYGKEYVSEKYNIPRNCVSSIYSDFKILIETREFDRLDLDKVKIIPVEKLIKIYKDMISMSRLDFYKKYRIRYCDGTHTKFRNYIFSVLGVPTKRKNTYNDNDYKYVKEYYDKHGLTRTSKHLCEKYGIVRSSANSLIKTSYKHITGKEFINPYAPVRFKNNMEKFKFVYEFQKYGIEHIMRKYNYSRPYNAKAAFIKYKKQLKLAD